MKKSISRWIDLTDNHLYNPGDAFPHDGRDIPEERIRELESSENKTGNPVIAEDDKPSKKDK